MKFSIFSTLKHSMTCNEMLFIFVLTIFMDHSRNDENQDEQFTTRLIALSQFFSVSFSQPIFTISPIGNFPNSFVWCFLSLALTVHSENTFRLILLLTLQKNDFFFFKFYFISFSFSKKKKIQYGIFIHSANHIFFFKQKYTFDIRYAYLLRSNE